MTTAPILEGKPHVSQMSDIDLQKLNREIRLQRIVFLTAKDVYDDILPDWKGNKEFLLAQLVQIVEEFIHLEYLVRSSRAIFDKMPYTYCSNCFLQSKP